MYTLYKINADKLDSSFLKGLKAMFKNKEIEIVVCEAVRKQRLFEFDTQRRYI